ncbi:MAG: hypothetical protein ACE5GC_04050 [Acidimicrobiia bacterium]
MFERIRTHPRLAMFAAAYYLVFLGIGFTGPVGTAVTYAVFMPVAFAIVLRVDMRAGLTTVTLAGLAVWGLGHMAGGLVPIGGEVLYEQWLLPFLRFDHVVHAVGFGFAGLAVWETLRVNMSDATAGAAGTVVFLGGMGLGGLNELLEFLITRVSAETNVGGFENTGWDLAANSVGTATAATWVALSRANRRRPSGQPAS